MLLDDYTEDKEWVTTNYGKLIKPVLPINNDRLLKLDLILVIQLNLMESGL
jgi:hypothetical protein